MITREDLIGKIHTAIIKMMQDVIFDEKEHHYTRISDGKWLAGVSSIADLMPKEFLIPWASKEAVKYLGYENIERATEVLEIIKNLKPTDKSVPELFQELLHKAKLAYKNKSSQALIDGKDGHAYLEKWVLSKIRSTEEPKLEEEKLMRPIEQFKNWAESHINTWILAEARVADITEEFAGTLDALAITKENKLSIIDFKFSNNTSLSWNLQTAGYSIPFEKYGIEIEDRIIIRLPKTLTKSVFNQITKQYVEIPNNIEIIRSPFSFDYDKEMFRHARALYRYTNSAK